MKAVEFQSTLSSDQTLKVPATVADTIPQGQTLRVLILIAENDAELEWEQLAAVDLGTGYVESDTVYDQISGQ